MNYVILDLETTLVMSSDGVKHIIEIGAVKIKKRKAGLEITDTFQMYVKPPVFDAFNKRTLRFIGASHSSFKGAPQLPYAINKFKKWLGSENYYLCTWSSSDLWMLAGNRSNRTFDLSWVKNFNDIQPMIAFALTGEMKQISLKRALKIKNGETGAEEYHSALLDSFSTASLFMDSFNIIEEYLTEDSNPFSAISSPLFITCNECGKARRVYSNKKKGRCPECRMKSREAEDAKKSIVENTASEDVSLRVESS